VAAPLRVAEKCGMPFDVFLRTINQLESTGRLAIDSSDHDVQRNAKRYILALT
jgi:hypothetical protein